MDRFVRVLTLVRFRECKCMTPSSVTIAASVGGINISTLARRNTTGKKRMTC